jgi:hypothetical protein
MLTKSSIVMILLIATITAAASLIGISSIYQYEERQVLPTATAQSQQQTQITGILIGKIDSFIIYSSSDGKACIAFATISTKFQRPNYPLGLKPGDSIGLLVPDQTMCAFLGQANIAKIDLQFRVALPAVTVKAIPSSIQQDFPPNQRLYRIVWIVAQ